MHTINTALCFDSNNKAKLKLRVITLLEESGWQAVSIAFPGISRATVYRWRKRYMDSDKKLQSLIPKSTKPHKTRDDCPSQSIKVYQRVKDKVSKTL